MYKSIFFAGLLVISSLNASEATSYDEWLEKRTPLEAASYRLFEFSKTEIDDPQKIFANINFETVKINKRANNFLSLLDSAVCYGKPKTIAFLLDHKAAIDAPDYEDHTALMRASKNGHAPVVTLLLDRKADPEKSDRHGHTALMLASYRHHKAVIEQLLLHKANTEVTHWFGGTPLTVIADQEPYPEKKAIIQLLLAARANPTHKTSTEKTAKDYATEIGDHATAALLAEYEQQYDEKKAEKPSVSPMREASLERKKDRKQSGAKKSIAKHRLD